MIGGAKKESRLRVLHYQHMGVGVILSEALRKLGVDSRVVATSAHPFGFDPDYLMGQGEASGLWKALGAWRLRGYQVLHNHDTRVPRSAALAFAGRLVQHYHSSTAEEVGHPAASLVSLPGLLRSMPSAQWMPLPSRTQMFRPDLLEPHDLVRVGFSGQATDPTKPQLIPSDQVTEAVRDAHGRAEAAPLAGVVAQDAMPSYYAGIDIWVDRFGCGFYGFSAIEAAAMGIPVIAEIGDFERELVPSCPFIVPASRAEVAAVVAELITDGEARRELGARARQFVVEVHDRLLVARRCLDVYEKVLAGG